MSDPWSLMGLDEGGLPIHLPMAVNRSGQGPEVNSQAHSVCCWCNDPKCPVTRALGLAVEVGERRALERVEVERSHLHDEAEGERERAEWAIDKGLSWRERAERAERERDLLLQAMWDARTELGFDPDGDHGYHSTNYEFIAKTHVQEAKQIREDLEEGE